MLVVDTEERRRGIARLLLKAASQAARAAGCDTIELAAANQTLTAFAQAAGFTPTHPLLTRSLRKRAETP